MRGHRQSADMHYVACVGQNAVSVSVVHEMCLRSFCVGLPREPLPRDKKCVFVWENAGRKVQKSVLTCIMHFTWPAWDKTQCGLALFANLFCVASVLRQFETSARLEFLQTQ